MGPTPKKKKNETNNKRKEANERTAGRMRAIKRGFFFKIFLLVLFLRFTEIGPPDFVGINTESALRDEGYA